MAYGYMASGYMASGYMASGYMAYGYMALCVCVCVLQKMYKRCLPGCVSYIFLLLDSKLTPQASCAITEVEDTFMKLANTAGSKSS